MYVLCIDVNVYFQLALLQLNLFVYLLFQHLILFTKEMVMEKPSPLLVGREFVRQYYTLLNKAPDFLHR